MAKQKTQTKEEVLESIKSLNLEDQLYLAKELASLISEQEKEAEQRLNLIRGGK